MVLTAAAVAVGGGVILFDPIFQGLAVALIGGEVAATLLSRIAVPVLYYPAAPPRRHAGTDGGGMKLVLDRRGRWRGSDRFRGGPVALGAPGYTEMPVLEGSGRTGRHAGDRVHPGALAVVFTIVADEAAGPLFDALVARRDAAGDGVSRLFLLPVERQA